MQARIVEARQGAIWLLDGWRLFRAAPLAGSPWCSPTGSS